MPLSKIKKYFCCSRSLFPGLFKILTSFPTSIQCWKIFPGIWNGDEFLYFSFFFCCITAFIAHYTVLFIFTLETKAFSYFPLYFFFVWCAMSKLSLWELQRAVLCWKHRFSWLCLGIFWEPEGWMLFTECYLQTCLNGLSLNSQLPWIYTLYGWDPCNKQISWLCEHTMMFKVFQMLLDEIN